MVQRLIVFLIVNFSALGLGGLFTGKGVTSDWYANLDKAPWTPPGWVFGMAWTTIMIFFSFYMAYLWEEIEDKSKLIILFGVQWILNVSWNPMFFYFQNAAAGMIIITGLTLLVTYFLFSFHNQMQWKSIFVLPYFLWLLIATSLNAYILVNN